MGPAAPTAAMRPLAALRAMLLLVAWLGRADALAQISPRCTGGNETAQLRCLLDEKDALLRDKDVIIAEKDGLIDAKDALLEASRAQIDQQRATIEALQATKGTDPVRSMDLQVEARRYPAASAGAPGDTDKDATARLARRREIDRVRRTLDVQRSAPPPAEDEDKPRRMLTPPVRQQEEARRLAGEAGQLCTDYPAGWVSSAGDDCHVYVQAGLCTPDGNYGSGWWESRYSGNTFDYFAANNATALTACCGCGGGKPCTDTAGWADKNGNTCADYTSKGYCDGDGGTGAGWPSTWGTLANQTLAGKASADTACCACRPRAKDASGRGCDYYALHPAQCGCCDDDDFRAKLTCSSACSTSTVPSDLTLRLAEWTNDTRMMIFPQYSVWSSTILSDWNARFPHLQTVKITSNNLQGTLSPELGLLPELRFLDLGNNAITGSIPAQPNFFKNLRYLYLWSNLLTGTVPPIFGQRPDLVMLWLTDNQLTGTIPPELGNLPNLKELRLGFNMLQGTVPPVLAQLTNLERIRLNDNQLTSTIPPELGNLHNLKELRLANNMIDGTVPPTLGQLVNLEVLKLEGNQLKGSIPPEIWNLVKLKDLRLSNNKLDGTLAPTLGNLTNLQILYFEGNQFTGSIPPELGNLVKLTEMRFAGNKMTGSLTPTLGKLVNLQMLLLDGNQLTGTIAPTMGQLVNLERLWLQNNQLTGSIPPELANLPKLRELRLTTNTLTGTLAPTLGQLVNLEVLWLGLNQLTGSIPPELGNLPKLRELQLDGNMLDGTIPPALGRLGASLVVLYLQSNQLTGTIPPELGNLTGVKTLKLAYNQLEGTLPAQLGNLVLLEDLELPGNKLTGTLPSTLGKLVRLQILNLYINRFSGSLPAELGGMTALTLFELAENEFSGTLPTDLGNLTQLQQFDISNNRFRGPVPKELGLLQQVVKLDLGGNNFTSLPAEIGNMKALQSLDVRGNPSMSGTFPDTSGCPKLTLISASQCNFTTAGAVGPAVRTLQFEGNSFTSLPDSWVNLPAVTELDLAANKISTWSPFGVLRLGTFLETGYYTCGETPVRPRLNWTEMEKVDLSGNPLGNSITVRDFLWSFGYLRRLLELWAPRCGLRGDVPKEGSGLTYDMPTTGDYTCNGSPPQLDGYPALVTLDLSGNNITSVRAPRPARLSLVRLGDNALEGAALHPSWYSLIGSLDVSGNERLRYGVDPPQGDTGCPSAGVPGLQADGFGWTEISPGDGYQCTTLCVGIYTRYKNDPWLNVSSLCRCKAGLQGAATKCSACPPNTFSAAEDKWGMVRTCHACPPLSTTDDGVENATSVDQCRCQPGWYMAMVPVEGNITPIGNASNQAGYQSLTAVGCVQCKQREFQTTVRGATQESQCVCSPSYEGLRALLGLCGCVDGQYMDHAAKKCRSCDSSSEQCTWLESVELSLLPPVTRAGYWAEPWADDEVGKFSKSAIWRCVSKETCMEGSICADGREGRACSLCSAGMYGGPDGDCKPCPRSPAESRKSLLLGLLIGPAATLAAHILLQGGEKSRQAALSLPAVRTSVKQLLKYVQMLGVMSVFNVHWPNEARNFFTGITRIVVALPQVAGVACLSDRQTASLEMGFRWLLPVAGLVSACLTWLLLLPTRWLCRGWRYHDYLKMHGWDVLRVCFWGLVLFQSTLLQFGTQMLMCVSSPNGVSTVLTFPHLQCRRGDKEWVQLAGISFAFLVAGVLAVFAGAYAAWRRTMHTLVDSNFKSRGWWGFLFSDLRAGSTHWVMLIMAKDIGLVVIAMAGAGNGAAQLLATAVGATIYSYFMLRDQPFNDPSNNFLEAWTAMSLAALAIFSAGMGYQATAGEADVAALYQLGANDALYKSRAQAMFVLQWITLLGPAGVIMYQVATLSDRVKRRLPLSLRLMTEEERTDWNNQFLSKIGIDRESNAATEFHGVVENFDEIDSSQFRSLMGTSTATLGLIPSHVGGLHALGRRRMEYLASRSGSFRRSVTSSSQGSVFGGRSKSGTGDLQEANNKREDKKDADQAADLEAAPCAMGMPRVIQDGRIVTLEAYSLDGGIVALDEACKPEAV